MGHSTKSLRIEVLQEAVDAYKKANGNKTHAASILGLKRSAFRHRLDKAIDLGLLIDEGIKPKEKILPKVLFYDLELSGALRCVSYQTYYHYAQPQCRLDQTILWPF